MHLLASLRFNNASLNWYGAPGLLGVFITYPHHALRSNCCPAISHCVIVASQEVCRTTGRHVENVGLVQYVQRCNLALSK